MGNVTNLNRFRKQKARSEKRARADENAARHGQSKSSREATRTEQDRAVRHLDGHALQKPQNSAKDTPEEP